MNARNNQRLMLPLSDDGARMTLAINKGATVAEVAEREGISIQDVFIALARFKALQDVSGRAMTNKERIKWIDWRAQQILQTWRYSEAAQLAAEIFDELVG